MVLKRDVVWHVVGFTLSRDGRAEVALAIHRSDSDFAVGVPPIGVDKVTIPANVTKSDMDTIFAQAAAWVARDPAWTSQG